jgi:hypothetical protein
MMSRKYGFVRVITVLFTLFFAQNAHAQQAGTMRYNSTAKQYEFYDGSQWYYLGLGLALGSCTQEAQMDYDPLLAVASYKYCNGTNWIRIVGVPTLMPCSGAGTMDYMSNTFMVCNGLLWTNIKGFLSA